MTFKNALCLTEIPEGRYSGLSARYRLCQRKSDHSGPHRSWSREWRDGDKESNARLDNGPIFFDCTDYGGVGHDE